MLIAVEGIDGAGKTTLAHTLARQMRARDIAVSISKEPTAGPWGAKLRASAAEGRLSHDDEVRFLLLDRQEHVDTLIKPALARDEFVILDRYYPSMAAYQGANGTSVSEILLQNAFAPKPDLTLVLDLEPAEGLARIRARGDKPNHFETEDNLSKCREIFLTMKLPGRAVIDASRPAEDVLRAAWTEIVKAVSIRLSGSGLTVENGEAIVRLGSAMEA